MKPPEALLHVNKPNPYVIVETKEDQEDHQRVANEKPKEVVYKYPKSKIFVGGLDFKLTNQDLQQHFSQYGAIESAVILKNINNGQSRGFGFVTFKDEAVAQDLIQNM
jgi:RNA recognition motif-containing protein